MKGIIWYYNNYLVAKERFEKLVEDYEKLGIKGQIKKFSTQFSAIFENGDYWITARATDHSKGHKCNISLIERCIPDVVIHTLILPCMVSPPYHAYSYYN